MDPTLSLFISFALLLGLIVLGIHVGFALLISALILLVMADPAYLDLVLVRLYESMNEFALIAIPMFILLGNAIGKSRVSEDLYEFFHRLLYRVPGGLAAASVFAAAIFSALSGSSPATAAAIGRSAIPEMLKRNYPTRLATGSVAAGGTLGVLIPPSVTMIVYGIATDTSIGKLFLAGVFPGMLLAALFAVWSVIYFRLKAKEGNVGDVEATYTLRDKLVMAPKILPFILIIIFILWALYFGVATPSEVAALGALAALALVALIYRIRLKNLSGILIDSVKDSVMVMFIIAASYIYGVALSALYVTQTIAMGIASLDLSPWQLLIIINAFLFLLGFFLPPVSVIVITTPMLWPAIESAGIDPIWYGVMLTINLEAGLITPPVGLNLFVIKAIAPNVSYYDIFMGSLPYIGLLFASIAILFLFPQIALWLPNQVITR